MKKLMLLIMLLVINAVNAETELVQFIQKTTNQFISRLPIEQSTQLMKQSCDEIILASDKDGLV